MKVGDNIIGINEKDFFFYNKIGVIDAVSKDDKFDFWVSFGSVQGEVVKSEIQKVEVTYYASKKSFSLVKRILLSDSIEDAILVFAGKWQGVFGINRLRYSDLNDTQKEDFKTIWQSLESDFREMSKERFYDDCAGFVKCL